MFTFFLFLVLISVPVIAGSQSADNEIHTILYILESPKSQMIPVNTNAVFTCRAYCAVKCDIDWIVNNSVVANYYQKTRLKSKGFSFSRLEHFNTTYTVRLTINASTSVNDTQLMCNVFQDHIVIHDRVTSNLAKLIVITASPIFPNPSISIQNTSFLLQWCPPFLWPGHYIQYFNITVTNMKDNTFITFDLLNATFSDALVSYIYMYSIDSKQSQLCTELLFGLSAITGYGESLSTFHIKGEHSAIPGEFLNSYINISMLFTTSLTPLVNLNIKLPGPVCNFQEVNYTIMVTDINGSIVSEHGPYHQLGSEHILAGIVHLDVSSGLMRDEEYYITLILTTISYMTSNSYHFDTKFEGDLTKQPKACEYVGDAQLAYQVFTGISGIFLFILLFLLVVLLACTFSKKQMYHENNSQTRLFQSMVHNPIYNGPEYEHIYPQYESLQLVPQRQDTVGESTPGSRDQASTLCDQTSTPSTKMPCHFD